MWSGFNGMVLFVLGCGAPSVSSDAEVELAYLGLDKGIQRAMGLGFAGFNAASNANIPEQAGAGDVSGLMTVTGKVDQGASDNKGMRLDVMVEDYQDIVVFDAEGDQELSIAYWTDPDDTLPHLALQLRDIPDGSFSGTLEGRFAMEGDLEGGVTLALVLDGLLEDDGSGNTGRAPGSVHITGTATSDGGGAYTIDLTL